MFRNPGFRLLLILALVGGALAMILPLGENLNLGLDLRGGMHLVYRVETETLTAGERRDAAERAVEIIRNRIDELGVKEPVISPQGSDRILIQLPGVVDRSQAFDIIGRTAQLEFKLVENDQSVIQANTPDADSEHEWRELEGRRILLEKETLLKGSALEDAQIGFGQYGDSVVSIEFNAEGQEQFANITRDNVGRQLAVLLDDDVQTAPVIQEPILTGDAQITGDFTPEEAKSIALVLRSGALPAPLVIEEERTVGPLLGQDSIDKGIKATIIGVSAVSVFMIVYYLFAGVLSVVALICNLIFILAGLIMMGATLTLPGIAGIILTLGMAVDANVLIFERIREELSQRRPLAMALRIGYQKAFRTILDSNLTTLIAAMCLFVFGTGPIKGFGVTLVLGIIASMFTAIFVTRTLFDLAVSSGMIKSLPMMQMFKSFSINFISKVKPALIFSTVFIVVGFVSFLKMGNAVYGVDFSGGQVQEYQFSTEVETAELRGALAAAGLDDFTIYEYSTQENAFAIKSGDDTLTQVRQVLDERYPGQFELLRVDKVGPVVGNILRQKAILAILFAIGLILVYVTARFHHFDFGVAAVLALLHDILFAPALLIAVAVMVPGFMYRIDLLIVTALLTIAGYSINDTIVIYDRIRELRAKMHKATLPEVINTAINQTMSRTILTSLTTLLTVVVLYFFGSENLKSFSLTLLVGFVAGVYSSIFIAAPLVILLRKKA
jgi:SecD/SecF fusion protein